MRCYLQSDNLLSARTLEDVLDSVRLPGFSGLSHLSFISNYRMRMEMKEGHQYSTDFDSYAIGGNDRKTLILICLSSPTLILMLKFVPATTCEVPEHQMSHMTYDTEGTGFYGHKVGHTFHHLIFREFHLVIIAGV